MKKCFLTYLLVATSMFTLPAFSQTEDDTLLGLPGDNLDLYAVLDLFQKSKTIEEFEKLLKFDLPVTMLKATHRDLVFPI